MTAQRPVSIHGRGRRRAPCGELPSTSGATVDDGVMVRNGRDTATGSEERTARTRAVVRVLGGFTATVGDDAVNLGGPRQRGVLARILVGGAEAVSADQLLHDVWGERAVEA